MDPQFKLITKEKFTYKHESSDKILTQYWKKHLQ